MFIDNMASPLVEEALKNFGAVELYQSPLYLAHEAQRLGGRPCYWLDAAEPNCLIPLVSRVVEGSQGSSQDLISPYGYPGYLARSANPVNIHRWLGQFFEEARDGAFVSTLIRLNPLTSAANLGTGKHFHMQNHNQIVYIDLAQEASQIRLGYRYDHRTSLRKLAAKGFTACWEAAGFLDDFIAIYSQTMERLDAASYYYFDRNYYQTLLAAAECRFISVRDSTGRLAAVGMFLVSEHCIQYHLSGTERDFLKLAPSKLMIDFVVESYASIPRCFILGGGLGSKSDQLFKFKSGFSASTLPFSTLRMIHDPQKYRSLTASVVDLHRDGLEDDFFPAYRLNE